MSEYSYYINSKEVLNSLLVDEKKSHFYTDRLGYRIYDNATILPRNRSISTLSGGVITKNGEFIENTALHEEYYDGSYSYKKEDVIISEKTAVFLGSWINIYGHAITDNIKKLWFLFTDEGLQLLNNTLGVDIVYICLSRDNIAANYVKDIISTIGLDFSRFENITQITQYKNVIVPDNSLILKGGMRYFTSDFLSIIERIKCNCHSTFLYNSIYLTRSYIHDNKDYNEKLIESEFEKRGYKVISPERLNFREQVALMKNCTRIVTTVGSVSHNILFCNDNTQVVLLNKANYVNGYQQAINKMHLLKIIYIDAHRSIRKQQPWTGPFFLWVTPELCKFLDMKSKPYYFSTSWYNYLYSFVWEYTIRPWLFNFLGPLMITLPSTYKKTVSMKDNAQQIQQMWKVCINCATYNHSLYIENAMHGFCKQQTKFPFVAIIVDDASTDGAQNVIRNYLQDFFIMEDSICSETEDYLHLFARHRININCYFAVYLLKSNHYSINRSKSPYYNKYNNAKYIALCEGDDYWIVNDKLQRQVEFLESHNNYSMVYTAFQTVNQEGDIIERENYERMMQRSRSGDILPMLLETNFILTCTTIFRRDIFDQPWYQGLSFAHDYTLFLTASICGYCAYFPERMSAYRKNPNGAMATRRNMINKMFNETKIWVYDGLCSGRIPIEKKRFTYQIKKYIATVCILQDNQAFKEQYRNIVKQNRCLWIFIPLTLLKLLIVKYSHN